MISSWVSALGNYDYFADLTKFNKKVRYADSFQLQIDRSNVEKFENSFRIVCEAGLFSKYATVGEVCFWKLYNKEDRDSITIKILDQLKSPENFNKFCRTLHALAEKPTKENFILFRQSCAQVSSFAVPITFLSFYRSSQYPMADSYVASWWNSNRSKYGYPTSVGFTPTGVISGDSEHLSNNWVAYLEWTEFCQNYAKRLTSKTDRIWLARDVEMAVFYAQQRRGYILYPLEEKNSKSDIETSEVKIRNPLVLTGTCPKCGHPLKWRNSSVTGESYQGCTNYPNCNYKGTRSH